MNHNFGNLVGFEVSGSEVKVAFEKETAYFTVVREDIVRVYVPFFDDACKSKAIEENPCVPVNFTVEKEDEILVIRTDKVMVKIQDDFVVDLENIIFKKVYKMPGWRTFILFGALKLKRLRTH